MKVLPILGNLRSRTLRTGKSGWAHRPADRLADEFTPQVRSKFHEASDCVVVGLAGRPVVVRQRIERASVQLVWPRLRLRRTFVLCTRAKLL